MFLWKICRGTKFSFPDVWERVLRHKTHIPVKCCLSASYLRVACTWERERHILTCDTAIKRRRVCLPTRRETIVLKISRRFWYRVNFGRKSLFVSSAPVTPVIFKIVRFWNDLGRNRWLCTAFMTSRVLTKSYIDVTCYWCPNVFFFCAIYALCERGFAG